MAGWTCQWQVPLRGDGQAQQDAHQGRGEHLETDKSVGSFFSLHTSASATS